HYSGPLSGLCKSSIADSQESSFRLKPSHKNSAPIANSARASTQYRRQLAYANQTDIGKNSMPKSTRAERSTQPGRGSCVTSPPSSPPERRGDDTVETDQRNAFDPDRLAIVHDDRRGQRREQQRRDQERWHDERQDWPREHEGQQHQRGADDERNEQRAVEDH